LTHIKQTYRPDIDGLRGLSIVLALIYHGFAYALPGGFIGADVFFVISGYLITGQIYEQANAGNFSFLNFYSRRIRRIFPPLIVVLIFVGLYGYFRLNLDDFSSLFKHIAAGTVFMSNFVLWQEVGYFDQQSALKPLLHLWSLAIEEQFYVLWPLMLVALTALSRHYRNTLIWTLILVCTASFVMRFYLASHDPIAAFYSPLSRFWELGIGGLLAALEMRSTHTGGFNWSQRGRDITAAAGSICLIVCAFLLSGQEHFPSLLATLPALSTVAIIAAGPAALTNRVLLSSKPMIQLGLISYALYLWHWPLLSFIHIEGGRHNNSPALIWLALAISVVLAAITRSVVEQPIRRNAAGSVPILLAATCLCIGIVGVIGYQTNMLKPPRLELQAQIKEQVSTAMSEYNFRGIPSRNCAELTTPESLAYGQCTVWGADDASQTVVVWGDSMSTFWMPPFLALAREGSWRVIQMSHFNCPPIAGVQRRDADGRKCGSPQLQAQEIDVMRRARPDVVFVIARWNMYYHGHIKNDVLVDNSFITDGPEPTDATTARAAFERRLPETLELLSTFSRVVIFKDTPVLKVPVSIGQSTRPDNFEPLAAEHKQFQAPINQVIDAAVAHAPGVIAFDPSKRLCDATKCQAWLAGLPAYFDEVHLTAHAALQFLPDIRSLGAAQ
jgi:peptidoglycan/LPS O-acetylase OafA/YrhL